MLNELIHNQHLVEALWSAVDSSAGSLVNVAPLLKKVLKTGAWRERIVEQLGQEPVIFSQFADFITTPPLEGCGWPLDKVVALIRDDPETLAMYRDEITLAVGVNQHSDNITTLKPERGTSLSYTLSRLKRERSDLFEKVVAREMSANAAATQAGFRKKLAPFEKIEREFPKLTDDEIRKLNAMCERKLGECR